MKPKKKDIERLVQDGVMTKVDKRVSAAFLLMNLAYTYMDDAEELLKPYRITIGPLKKELSLAKKHYEAYASNVRTLVNHADLKLQSHFFEDFEYLEKLVTGFLEKKQNPEGVPEL